MAEIPFNDDFERGTHSDTHRWNPWSNSNNSFGTQEPTSAQLCVCGRLKSKGRSYFYHAAQNIQTEFLIFSWCSPPSPESTDFVSRCKCGLQCRCFSNSEGPRWGARTGARHGELLRSESKLTTTTAVLTASIVLESIDVARPSVSLPSIITRKKK